MAGKTSKASTPRPRKAGLKAGNEAFAQAYASNGGNAADAYRKAYPRCKSAHAAETNGSLLLRNTEVAARISEILRRGAERAEVTVEQVLRELAKIGFSDIRKAVAWRNEMVAREDEEVRKGEDGVVHVPRVLMPRVSIVPSEEMDPDIAAAIPQISQGPNGEVRVRLHDKHAASASIGKHLGMFTDHFKVDVVYGISEEPMSAEEWKKQFVKEG